MSVLKMKERVRESKENRQTEGDTYKKGEIETQTNRLLWREEGT